MRTNAFYRTIGDFCGSPVPGTAKPKLAPANSRSPATMRELLEWAYAKQMVRHARDGSGYSPRGSSLSPTGRICGDLAAGAVIRGGIGAGTSTAHPDAYAIDDFVSRLAPEARQLIVRHAEAQRLPDWSPRLPPLVALPVLRGRYTLDDFRGPDGLARFRSVRTLPGKKGQAIASMIAYEGFPPARAEAVLAHARATYALWHEALRILHGALQIEDCLTRWRVTGHGAEREPWARREA